MNTPIFNAQFLTIDFRLLDNPEFGAFMRTTAFGVYLQMRRYIWRSRDRLHPIAAVNELRGQGKLVCSVERGVLARKLGIVHQEHVSRHITHLVKMGAIHTVRTGRQSVFILGTWEDRSAHADGTYIVELFFLEQLFGVEKRPQISPERGLEADVPEIGTPDVPFKGTSEMRARGTSHSEMLAEGTAEMAMTATSDVSPKPTNKYNKKEIQKQQRSSLLSGFAFSRRQLAEIEETYSADRIKEVVAACRSSEERIDNPTGWVLAALQGGYEFDSAGKRVQARVTKRREIEAETVRKEAEEEAQREATDRRIRGWIESHAEEYATIVDEERRKLSGSRLGGSEAVLRVQARCRVWERLEEERRENAGAEITPPVFAVRSVGSEASATPERSAVDDSVMTQPLETPLGSPGGQSLTSLFLGV